MKKAKESSEDTCSDSGSSVIDESGGANSEMKWKKSGNKKKKVKATIARELSMYRDMLVLALKSGREKGKFKYKDESMRSKWMVVTEYSKNLGGGGKRAFMGVVKFTEWFTGLRETELKPQWIDTINSFCKMYSSEKK